MALTKEDLKAIGNLIDDKLSKAIDPIKKDIAEMKERSKQAAIRRQQERQADKEELKSFTQKVVTDRVEKLKAKFK